MNSVFQRIVLLATVILFLGCTNGLPTEEACKTAILQIRNGSYEYSIEDDIKDIQKAIQRALEQLARAFA